MLLYIPVNSGRSISIGMNSSSSGSYSSSMISSGSVLRMVLLLEKKS